MVAYISKDRMQLHTQLPRNILSAMSISLPMDMPHETVGIALQTQERSRAWLTQFLRPSNPTSQQNQNKQKNEKHTEPGSKQSHSKENQCTGSTKVPLLNIPCHLCNAQFTS
jgi:hypothetical protein